jgi:hypothetical protein
MVFLLSAIIIVVSAYIHRKFIRKWWPKSL